MKIIVQFPEGDGCTYCCETTVPFIADSVEALYFEIEDRFRQMVELCPANQSIDYHALYSGQYDSITKLKSGNITISLFDIFNECGRDATRCMQEFSFYTVDEWFTANGLNSEAVGSLCDL